MPPKRKKLRIVKRPKSTDTTASTTSTASTETTGSIVPSQEEFIEKYKEYLPEIDRQAMEIAMRQLETSFCIEKSIGFLKFVENFKNQ